MEHKLNYYAIIPADVRYADIPANAKLLYWEITALTNKEWYCRANNTYFAKLYKKSNVSISKWISVLQENWFINIEIISEEWNKRKIYIWNFNTSQTKVKEVLKKSLRPIKEKFKHNNKYNNTSNNNISKDILYISKKTFKNLIWEHLTEEFINKIKDKFEIDLDIIKLEMENFYLYWTEKNPAGTKERWEMQKTFDIQRRFYTWIWNNKKWAKPQNKKELNKYDSIF